MRNTLVWTENKATISLSHGYDVKREARGEMDMEEIILLLYYATSLAAKMTEQHHLSRE